MGNLAAVIPRRLFSLPTACALCLITPAALAEYRFDVWTADSGLPQNSIRRILQSRDGYLWLSTSDGVVRFDGVRSTVFDKANSPGGNSRPGSLTVLVVIREVSWTQSIT